MSRNDGAKAEKQQARRSEILDAAASIFYGKGYEATSVQEVADEVGLLKGSLYHYIDSKEDLLFEVMDRVHSGLESNWRVNDAEDEDPLSRIRRFVHQHVLFTTENLTDVRVFLQDFRAIAGERRTAILRRRDSYERVLRELIDQADREGQITLRADAKLMTFAVFGMVNWVSEWYEPGGRWSPGDLAEIYSDLAVRLLVSDSSDIDPGSPDE